VELIAHAVPSRRSRAAPVIVVLGVCAAVIARVKREGEERRREEGRKGKEGRRNDEGGRGGRVKVHR